MRILLPLYNTQVFLRVFEKKYQEMIKKHRHIKRKDESIQHMTPRIHLIHLYRIVQNLMTEIYKQDGNTFAKV